MHLHRRESATAEITGRWKRPVELSKLSDLFFLFSKLLLETLDSQLVLIDPTRFVGELLLEQRRLFLGLLKEMPLSPGSFCQFVGVAKDLLQGEFCGFLLSLMLH